MTPFTQGFVEEVTKIAADDKTSPITSGLAGAGLGGALGAASLPAQDLHRLATLKKKDRAAFAKLRERAVGASKASQEAKADLAVARRRKGLTPIGQKASQVREFGGQLRKRYGGSKPAAKILKRTGKGALLGAAGLALANALS